MKVIIKKLLEISLAVLLVASINHTLFFWNIQQLDRTYLYIVCGVGMLLSMWVAEYIYIQRYFSGTLLEYVLLGITFGSFYLYTQSGNEQLDAMYVMMILMIGSMGLSILLQYVVHSGYIQDVKEQDVEARVLMTILSLQSVLILIGSQLHYTYGMIVVFIGSALTWLIALRSFRQLKEGQQPFALQYNAGLPVMVIYVSSILWRFFQSPAAVHYSLLVYIGVYFVVYHYKKVRFLSQVLPQLLFVFALIACELIVKSNNPVFIYISGGSFLLWLVSVWLLYRPVTEKSGHDK